MYPQHEANGARVIARGYELNGARRIPSPSGSKTLSDCLRNRLRFAALLIAGMLSWLGTTQPAFAQGATRDLSAYDGPGVTFTVTIAINSGGAQLVGVEDTPPAGWPVSNISDAGFWDPDLETVKWPPFTYPPEVFAVSYDVTPPIDPVSGCFAGELCSDVGPCTAIAGEACIWAEVPTLSQWGLAVMTLLIAAAGTLVLIHRRAQPPV